jgi:hypothetical protein
VCTHTRWHVTESVACQLASSVQHQLGSGYMCDYKQPGQGRRVHQLVTVTTRYGTHDDNHDDTATKAAADGSGDLTGTVVQADLPSCLHEREQGCVAGVLQTTGRAACVQVRVHVHLGDHETTLPEGGLLGCGPTRFHLGLGYWVSLVAAVDVHMTEQQCRLTFLQPA